MNKQIMESLNFLINEYKRLKKKKEDKSISIGELETLKKLEQYLGKK
tara:strand:- start:170 stop:310 length:141 start_codon:yes stop_codon:yes gene_type:complete